MQNSLANKNIGMWRRRSTLSRLGVRIGEHLNFDETVPILPKDPASHATGASRRRQTDAAQPSGVTGEDSMRADVPTRRADVELIEALRADIGMLRAERERRMSIPAEDPSSYDDVEGSEVASAEGSVQSN